MNNRNHYEQMNQILRAASMNDEVYYYNTQLQSEARNALRMLRENGDKPLCRCNIRWNTFNGSHMTTSNWHSSEKVARFEALRYAVKAGYTRPKWWQWWRWGEGRA